MTSIIQFLKNNPIVTVSAFIVLACIVFLIVAVQMPAASFQEEVKSRQDEIDKMRQLQRVPVLYPGEKPTEPYRNASVEPSPANIKAIQDIHTNIRSQYEAIFSNATRYNRDGVIIRDGQEVKLGPEHEPMLDDLFPTPSDQAGAPFAARREYPVIVTSWLQRPTQLDGFKPRLNAAPAISITDLNERLDKVEQQYMGRFFGQKSVGDLTTQEAKELIEAKRNVATKLITNHAKQIDLYAQIDPKAEDFPFQIPDWVTGDTTPTMPQLWEGQMKLWVMQDIARAIQMANEEVIVPEGETTPIHNGRLGSVLTAPVKRLIRVTVEDGVVGETSTGGVGKHSLVSSQSESERTRGRRSEYEDPYLQQYSRGAAADSAANQPATKGQADGADQPLPENFAFGLSGRRANTLYDVKHARVELIVDYRLLPVLFEKLARVNFMTVLEVEIQDIDEYEALRNGFRHYGQGDAVQVGLTIESIWLREWTKPLMPEEVRKQLRIPDDTAPTSATSPTPAGANR